MKRTVSATRATTRDNYFFYISIALVVLIAAINAVADIVSR
jgi:hypothetical protein